MLVLFLSLSCVLVGLVTLFILLLPFEVTRDLLLRKDNTQSKLALCVALFVSVALVLYSAKSLSGLPKEPELDQALLWRKRIEVVCSVIALSLFLLITRASVFMVQLATDATELGRLRIYREAGRAEQERIKEDRDNMKAVNQKLCKDIEALNRKLITLGTIETQAKNQQAEYLRLMDDNLRLMKIIERIDAEKEELISQLLAKRASDKKKD